MHFWAWVIALTSVVVGEFVGSGWAIGVLLAGAALLLVCLWELASTPKPPRPPPGPATVDEETRRIVAFDEEIVERERKAV